MTVCAVCRLSRTEVTGGCGRDACPYSLLPVCHVCLRGREACQYCEKVGDADWRAMCDCGLYDFGAHLLSCNVRESFLYVIACDYKSSALPRSLLAELEQAERERDEAVALADDQNAAASFAAARLAKVPALVEALRALADPLMASFTLADCQRVAHEAVAAFEQEQDVPS